MNNIINSIFGYTKKRKVMKVLNLIIKQKYFDAILAGRKVQEFREVRPTTIKKLLQLDADGFEVEDEHGNAQPIKYDAIQFYVGYNKDRDSALVEVLGAHCEVFVDNAAIQSHTSMAKTKMAIRLSGGQSKWFMI